jgi:hypothetical protein
MWRQSFAGAQHSEFHFIDGLIIAPHDLRIELNGEKSPDEALSGTRLVLL